MRLLEVNSVCGIESTGKIAVSIADQYENEGWDCRIAYGRDYVPDEYQKYAYRIGNEIAVRLNVLECRLFDNDGFSAYFCTKRFIKWAESFNPDVLWIHNLHGYYININLLFKWIKTRPSMKVYWTLHDCWAFTGHCGYFDFANCFRWKNECHSCPIKREYPASFFADNSRRNYQNKKRIFSGVENMDIITPSQWLADLVKVSILKEYNVKVVNNTINNDVFKPTKGNFKYENHISSKYILLGVANIWSERKGLSDFLQLFLRLPSDYCIILVGIDKKRLEIIRKTLSKNNDKPFSFVKERDGYKISTDDGRILFLVPRTRNAIQLAEIYTLSDVFINTTYEDNYPTVNLEANACGTTVITYNTGGSIETVPKENIVEKGDVEMLLSRVKELVGGGSI